MPAKALIAAMREIVGAGAVLDVAAECEPYLVDWRKRHAGRAHCVVLPGTTAQVSAVLAWCNANAVSVYPQGGNTSVCGGSVPAADGNNIVLNLARMNRIVELNARDNSITVEAGCILAAIQQAALDVDRIFPLSMGAEGSCQIGGNLATNAGGTNVLRFGNARDLVLGIEIVFADGRIWNGLRTLRKNNSGYDLKHLFIGSEGTLGVITAASLKLYPRARAVATALLGVAGAAAAVEEGIRLQAAFPGELVGLEIISRSEFDISLKHAARVKNPFATTPAWVVLVELATSADTADVLAERLTQQLQASFDSGAVESGVVASNEQQRQEIWRIRHSVTEANVREGMGLTHDIAVPIGKIPDFIDRAGAALAAGYTEAEPVIVGHMGDGNLHYIVMFSHAYWAAVADKESFQRRLSHQLYDIAAAMGGSFSAEHGIGALHVAEMSLYKDAEEIAIMSQVKELFDPRGIMNPRRVLPWGRAGHRAP